MTPRQFRDAVERRLIDERAALTARVDRSALIEESSGRTISSGTRAQAEEAKRTRTAARGVEIQRLRAEGLSWRVVCERLGLTDRQAYYAERMFNASRGEIP